MRTRILALLAIAAAVVAVVWMSRRGWPEYDPFAEAWGEL